MRNSTNDELKETTKPTEEPMESRIARDQALCGEGEVFESFDELLKELDQENSCN